jgi:hypothetical protein
VELGPELVTIDWRFTVDGGPIHKYTTFFLMHSRTGDPVPAKSEGISRCVWVPLEKAPDKISYENATEVVRIAQRITAERGPPAEAAD